MNATHEELRQALGAYVLRRLEPAEDEQVRAHLADCVACSEEYDRLAPLPGLLGRLDAAEAERGPVRPGDALLDRVLSRLDGQRRARRARLAALACGVVVAAGAPWAVVLGGANDEPAPPAVSQPPPGRTVSATDARTGVRADVTFRDVAWGTSLELTLKGVAPGERCRLDVLAAGGARETAATWAVPAGGYGEAPGGSFRVPGAAAVRSWQLDRFEVVTVDGRRLVTLPL